MLFAIIIFIVVLRGKIDDSVIVAPLAAMSLLEMILEWFLVLAVLKS